MENHCFAIALHFVYYNFAKIHKTLRVTRAVEAGLTKDVMTIEEIVRLADYHFFKPFFFYFISFKRKT